MKREVISICIVALFVLAAIPAGKGDAKYGGKPDAGNLPAGKMFLCHVTANGTGRFIWWLMGASFHDFGSIALSTVNFKNGGHAEIQSIFDPAYSFTVRGNQSMTLVNYVGYFVTEPDGGMFRIHIDGMAMLAIDVSVS